MTRATVSQSPFLPVWVWLIPIAALVLFLEALQPVGNPTERFVWYSVLIIIVATALTRVCRVQRDFDLFEPLNLALALFVIFYPVRALFAVWLDDSWFDPARAAIWKGLSASVLGFVCFAVGYKFGASRSTVRRRIWLDRSWNLQRANAVSLAFLLASLAGFLAVRVLGGSFFYFISLDSDIKAPGEIKVWFFYLLWICLLIQVGALIQFGVWLSTGRRVLWTFLYCVLALLSTFLMARYVTILFLMMVALSWHYKKRRIRTIQVAVLFFLVIGYLGVAGLYREWISPGYDLDKAGELAELAGQQDKVVIRYVVGNLEELSNLTEVISMTPSELPYQFGSTFTPIFLKPIPRVLMPAKPLGASALFSQHFIPELYDTGLVTALGAWGEWYMNFSWLGVILGMALTGALSSAAYTAMRATNEFGRVMLYASFVVVLFTWLRSDFNSATTYGLYYSIPAILALTYITGGKPESRQAAHI
jgi:oligosaccharide repeat unit polymerase